MMSFSNDNFDLFSSHYEQCLADPIKTWFGGDSSYYYVQLKADELCRHLGRLGLQTKTLSVLDVGCGIGLAMNMLETKFSHVSGVDASKGMIDEARKRFSRQLNFQVSHGDHLPFADNQFDVVYSMSLFHHVPSPGRLTVLREMTRVARNGGWVINFEHNSLNPVTRWVVTRCALDRDATLLGARELSSLCRSSRLHDIHTRFILFFPKTLKHLRRIETSLFWCPLGGQFYVAGRKLPSS